MKAEKIIGQIRSLQRAGRLSLKQGMNLLLAWNAIQNLEYMIFVTRQQAKEMAWEALADVDRPFVSDSITELEIEILDTLELV